MIANIGKAEENKIVEATSINEEIHKASKLKNIDSEQIDLEVQISKLKENKDTNLNSKTINKEKEYTNNFLASIDTEELEMLIDKKPDNSFTDKKPDNILKRLSTFFNNNQIDEKKVEPNLNNSRSDSENQNKLLIEENLPHDQDENIKIKVENSNDLFNQNEKKDTSKHQINLIDIEQNKENIDENILEIPAFLRRQAN